MTRDNHTISWRLALIIIAITSLVSPYISKIYRGYVGLTIFLLVIGMFVFLSPVGNYFTAIVGPAYRKNKAVFISIIWFIAGILVTYLRGANDISYLIQVLYLPLVFLIGIFLSQNYHYRSFAIISIIAFCFLNIISTGSAIDSTTSARDLYEESNKGLIYGTSGFWGLIGIFFPLFIAESMKQPKIFRWGLITILLFLAYKLLFSGFATPIGLLITNLLIIGIIYLFFVLRSTIISPRAILIILIVLGVVFFLFSTILKSEYSGMDDVKYRFTNFIEDPASGGYSKGSGGISRFKLIKFSWDSFVNKPLFGNGGNIRSSMYEGINGGHSSSFDFLAVLGIAGGGGAFLFFVWLSVRNAYRNLRNSKSFSDICNFAMVVTFIIGGILNPYWQGPILVTYLLVANIYQSRVFKIES